MWPSQSMTIAPSFIAGSVGPNRESSRAEPVEVARVVAEDALPRRRRHALEVLLDGLPGVRPRAVGVRVVGRPHHPVVAQRVDDTQADEVGLERRPHLAPEVLARAHRELEAALRAPEFPGVEELAIRVVHALQHVRQPADAGLGEDDLETRMALEGAG